MLRSKFNHIDYKKRNIQIWNEIAPRYHKRWASKNSGPFQSSSYVVRLSGIKKNYRVLDIACGTGVLTKKIAAKIGPKGIAVGIDTSREAIRIAKAENKKNLDFVISDAEGHLFENYFDAVTCQYALFFFPNSQKALRNAKRSLKKGGVLAITVHGQKNKVPFFASILDAVTKFIPDYIPPGSPNLDRFGTKKALRAEIKKAEFSSIKITEFCFTYSPGTFEDYWKNYLKYIAKPLKKKLDSLTRSQKIQVKALVKKNTNPFTKNGRIIFPWQVLILTAKK